jgi:hypothetical protein
VHCNGYGIYRLCDDLSTLYGSINGICQRGWWVSVSILSISLYYGGGLGIVVYYLSYFGLILNGGAINSFLIHLK